MKHIQHKILRDKIAVLKLEENPKAVIAPRSKQLFQRLLIIDMFKTASLLTDDDQEKNVKILAELETIIRHLAEMNKIPVAAIETTYNALANQYGLYNAQLSMEIEEHEPKEHTTQPHTTSFDDFSTKKRETEKDKSD